MNEGPRGIRRIAACICLLLAGNAFAQSVPMVDTHSHLDHGGNLASMGAALDQAVADMDRIGVRFSILLPPPQVTQLRVVYDCDQLTFAARRHPQRIGVVGGGGTLNPMLQNTDAGSVDDGVRRRFRTAAEEVLACGALGFGEIAAHHLSLGRMGAQHPYEWIPPDHPLMLLLADIAAEKGVPIDLHLDLVPADMPRPDRPNFNAANPAILKENLAGFERLLAYQRGARIIWAHAGSDPLLTRVPALQRQLLSRHPNLYMSLRPGPAKGGPPPAIAFDDGGALKPAWIDLIREFPDRFVLGSDEFHPSFADARRTPGIDGLRLLVERLPAEIRTRVAHENAERLFRLPAK